MIMTGAQAMVKSLECEGISVIFGYPGATICPFYDSLATSSIRHILTRTEQHAGHAASGYARTTRRPAVCVTTSGPGATNLITAIATAYADSIPLICITGQVSTDQLGRDVFQEVDTTGAVEPFTKYSYLVKDVKDIPRVFKEAFHIASTGRPGPVLIDMPQDIQGQELDFSYPEEVNIRGYKPVFKGHPMQVKRMAQAIKAAKQPLLCLGGGVFSSEATEQVRKLVELTDLPVVHTMMGIGVLPTMHPRNYGMLGHSGNSVANRAVRESDLLILIGTRAADRAVTSPKTIEKRTIIHVDIDAAEIGKNLGTTIPVVGDASIVLEQLMEKDVRGDWNSWLSWLDGERAALEPPVSNGKINPHLFIKQLTEAMEENATLVADVGQNQIWSARNGVIRAGRFLTTGGMGTMGYSIPAALGAKLADPDLQVVAVCGDGSFQMSLMELATANQHGIVLKLVVMRNGVLGMVREIQHRAWEKQESGISLDGSPDICGVAQAYGIKSCCIERSEQVEEAIREFLDSPQSYVLEVAVDKENTSV